MSKITDDQIRTEMEELVRKVDLETVTTKEFIKMLSKKLKVNLLKKRKFIKKNITEILDAMDDSDEIDCLDDEVEETDHDEGEKGPKIKKRKRKSTDSSSSSNPFNAPKDLSPPLGSFLGKKKLSRPQVIKSLWVYIKEHNLQNPENKREIILDDKMQGVFGVDRFSMFKMAKYISTHIHPYKPYSAENEDDLQNSGDKKKKKKNEGRKKAKLTEAAKNAIMPAYRLSDKLVKVVGTDVLSRQLVTKKLLEYIKEHDLQNPEDKREIICDDALKKVMEGRRTVTMFSMNKYISPHLIEKVDRIMLQPDDL